MERLAKIQIIVAACTAVLLFALRSLNVSADDNGIDGALEAISFLLCAVAVVTSAKALRKRYQAMGSDNRITRQSPEYLRMRGSVRWGSYFATLIITSLAAPRFGIPALLGVGIVAVTLPPAMIVADRASGWTTHSDV